MSGCEPFSIKIEGNIDEIMTRVKRIAKSNDIILQEDGKEGTFDIDVVKGNYRIENKEIVVSIINKPYLATDARGWVYLTDPELYRVLVFDGEGNYQYGFGQYSTGDDGLSLPTGIDIGPNGTIYVVDSGNSRVLAYQPIQ